MANISTAVGNISINSELLKTKEGLLIVSKALRSLGEPHYYYGVFVDDYYFEDGVLEKLANDQSELEMITIPYNGVGRWSILNTLQHSTENIQESLTEEEWVKLINMLKEIETKVLFWIDYEDVEQSYFSKGSGYFGLVGDNLEYVIIENKDETLSPENLPEYLSEEFLILNCEQMEDFLSSNVDIESLMKLVKTSKDSETYLKDLANHAVKKFGEQTSIGMIETMGDYIEYDETSLTIGNYTIKLPN